MSRTKRTKSIIDNNWYYKCNSHQDFKNSIIDYDDELLGYKPKSRHRKSSLLSSWDDKVPAAVSQYKIKQCFWRNK